MDLRKTGERRAVETLRDALGPTGDLGGGADDCAVVPLGDGRLLLASTDVVARSTHFLPGAPPGMLGAFAANVAVSDVAAMGGTPLALLCAYAMPPETDVEWLSELSRGMSEAASGLGAELVGGDTKASSEPTVAVTALGTVEGARCLLRSGAEAGDALVLTGPIGGPALGFLSPRDGSGRLTDGSLRLVYGVSARVDEGRAMSGTGRVRACIDLSDGLAPALHQLVEASGCGAILEWEALPVVDGLAEAAGAAGLALEEPALHWGGEYELLAAVDPEGLDAVTSTLLAVGSEPRVVGRVTEGRETLLVQKGAPRPLSPHGFDHFKEG